MLLDIILNLHSSVSDVLKLNLSAITVHILTRLHIIDVCACWLQNNNILTFYGRIDIKFKLLFTLWM